MHPSPKAGACCNSDFRKKKGVLASEWEI